MQAIQFFAARAEDGALLSGATVDVFLTGTQTRAPLFSDAAGATSQANPVYADGVGRVFFYTSADRIDIRVSRGGYVAPLIEDLLVTDPADILAATVAQVGLAEAKVGEASLQADRAESAATASIAASNTFDTTAAALLATADGQVFYLRTADPQVLDVWLNDGGVAVDQSEQIDIASGTQVKEAFDYVNELKELDPYVYILRDEDNNVVERIGDEGKRESLLKYTAESVDNGLSYVDVPGVSEAEIDEAGNVVSARFDGGPKVDFTEEPATAADIDIFDGIYDCCWNDWVYPRHLGFRGNSYLAPVGPGDSDGTPGDMWAGQKIKGAPASQSAFAQTNGLLVSPNYTDDHNSGAIIADPRTDADYPLMLFCTGHNGEDSVMQFWRSPTYSLDDLEQVSGAMPSRTGLSYSMVYRNPNDYDEIILWTRTGGSGNATWWLWRTLDNGETWTERAVFASEQLYFLGKPALDDSGLHLFCHQRPDRPDQRIGYLKFNWGGSITTPAGTYVADVYDGSFTAVDPWADEGLFIVHTPAAGYDTRLADGLETSVGIEFLWSEFTLANPEGTGQYKHCILNGSSVTISPDIAATGRPIEDTGDNYYIGGGAIYDTASVVVAANVSGGELIKSVLSGSDWINSTVAISSEKIARPVAMSYVSLSGNSVRPRIAYLDGNYTQYRAWSINLKIVEV